MESYMHQFSTVLKQTCTLCMGTTKEKTQRETKLRMKEINVTF